jgi:hypothetical protein
MDGFTATVFSEEKISLQKVHRSRMQDHRPVDNCIKYYRFNKNDS